MLAPEWKIDVRPAGLDIGFFVVIAALVGIGLIMVASSSLDLASVRYEDPWLLFRKQCVFLVMALCVALFIVCVPMSVWQRHSILILLLGIVILLLVLVPGVGRVVNGSRRWLSLGLFSMQASELAKFCLLVFFASFLARHQQAVRGAWTQFFIMIGLIGLTSALLLAEPDFGSAAVLSATLGLMMFVAGVPILRFLLVAIAALFSFAAIAVLSPYRWQRLVTFMDPWANPFDSGYQLVQSLIAFGRGEWTGLGLGNSLQKLFFLPEAHTDFIFSIYAEEFGLLGACLLIALFVFLVFKVFRVAYLASQAQRPFASYLCFGIGTLLAFQAFINMGVASGLLPTKGLTLPLISYGGSSLLITFALLALVARAAWEVKNEE